MMAGTMDIAAASSNYAGSRGSGLSSLRQLATRLCGKDDGLSAVEFGLIAPVFILMMIGGMDMLHTVYAKTMLRGAIEEAARNASLETGDIAAIDADVKKTMAPVLPNATVTTTRMSYFDFKDIGRPESWTDANSNGVCDNGEPFVDENQTGAWENDVGENGNGGASDVVIFTTLATYDPVFRVPFMESLQGKRTLKAQTVVKSQPYDRQQARKPQDLTCD